MSQKYNNASINNVHQTAKGGTYLAKYQTQQSQQPQQQQPLMPQFKPLVQVDPSLLQTNRAPLQNPRPGDYLLNKTASTEGIASKKSLELKKRYLLGEPANGNKIQKSGSTSVLDSRIRSFQSNISECQKLLNPSNDISSSMKTFLERTKSGDKTANELMRSATNNILNDLKVEITIQKASSTASTDNEKENVFVNSKNELNKCMESETLNKKSPTTPTNNTSNIIETIDLVTPEKENVLETSDSNKVIDLTGDSPIKSIGTIIEAVVGKPDLSLNVKQCIPDILDHIEKKDDSGKSKETTPTQEVRKNEEEVNLIESNMEKVDVPEKLEALYDNEVADVQIEVPNIAWNTKADNLTSTTNSSCSSSHSSSLEDIEHYILESTTSPETQHSGILGSSGSGNHQVPRLEIHDTSGTLMQIDSLMIIDGKYIGDPEDLKFMDIPEGVIVPEIPAIKTSEIEEEEHDVELEPVTATPEPTETTVIEKKDLEYKEHQEAEEIELPPPLPENGPPLPEKGPPKIKPTNLKFDTKNENKIESLKNLPLIVDASSVEQTKAVKPRSLNLAQAQKTPDSPTTPKGNLLQTPTSPLVDMDKTPTGDLLSKGSDSETEPTNTAQILTETELSDWTADDCISENFVDMDFVHHSEIKSNLKGYKKDKRKTSNNRSYLPTTNEVLQEVAKTAPVAEFEGILKSIDIDDIEFMDTGSDNSNTEPLSATNTALLRNRGYMEFVDTTPKLMKIQINTITTQPCLSATNETLGNSSKELYKPIQCKRDEKLGIDYIEQGAYILQQHLPQHHFEDNNKTPVNEVAQQPPAVNTSSSLMTQSLTDSSTINDLEDESTCNLSSQIHLTSVETCSKPSQQNTTTEESEALTVVTSPFDSSSPQQTQNSNMKKETAMEKEKTGSSTPSSSDRAPKSSQSSTCTNSATSSSKNTPPRQLSKDHTMSGAAKSNDELSYEEYVRALQQKIVQISTTARGDSLETTRKQRRKSSKGEAPLIALTNPNQTVIESTTTTTPSNLSIDKAEDIQLQTSSSSNAKIAPNLPLQLNKVPEIPTLSSKLEEITKERTKQKDLIHDLVMDKLQSKKQLNAEKRLHRSRQRSIITGGGGATGLGSGGGYSSGSSLSPTPKLAAANSTTDTNCTNQAHYHVSTAAKETSSSPLSRQTTAQRLLLNTNKPISPSTYVSAYGMEALSPTRANAYKQRPFSEHLEGDTLKAFEHRYKINKTPSFSITTTSSKPSIAPVSTAALATKSELSTPIPPLRQKRSGDNSAVTTPTDTKNTNFSVSTENLKSEARARARLKSNSELGLSPEEKMQLLRKRLQTEYNSNIKANLENEPQNPLSTNSSYERQHSLREQKMSNSKSVNDLAYLSQSQLQQQTVKSIEDAKKSDFTSDPNLLLSSTQQQQYLPTVNKLMKSKSSSRRAKDPERRKSLIQSLSNFFHKAGPQQNKDNKQQQKDNTASPSDGSSAHAERPGTGGGVSSSTSTSHTTVSSGLDGVLSRFRISPKSKEKSRVSCFFNFYITSQFINICMYFV